MHRTLVFVCLLLLVCIIKGEPVPTVLWHGMGDTCCFPFSMGRIKSMIEKQVGGNVYVHSIEVGNNIVEDEANGFIYPADGQIEYVCEKLAKDPRLAQGGWNGVGFSQGGQFLRALQQRCPTARMRNLITVGGQHQGVYGLPQCIGANVTLCNYMREMLNIGAYLPLVQNHLVQANYWHDPLNEAEYKKDCHFLPDINNENRVNQTYVERLQALEKFVMVMFEDDTVVQPRISEHFGFYDAGSGTSTHNLTESLLYQQDRLGLKKMNDQGKLVFLSSPGNHLQFTDAWFNQNIIPYLK